MTEQEGIAIKTGTNQGVPIFYFRKLAEGATATLSAPSSGRLYENNRGNEIPTLLEKHNRIPHESEGRKEQTSLPDRYKQAVEAQRKFMDWIMGR